jgi:hypothetical protein
MRDVMADIEKIRQLGEPVTLEDVAKLFPQVPPDQDAGPFFLEACQLIDRVNRSNQKGTLAIPTGQAYLEEFGDGGAECMRLIEEGAALPCISKSFTPRGNNVFTWGSRYGSFAYHQPLADRVWYTHLENFIAQMKTKAVKAADEVLFLRCTQIHFLLANQVYKLPYDGAASNAVSLNKLGCLGVMQYLQQNALNESSLIELEGLLRNQWNYAENNPALLPAMRAEAFSKYMNAHPWERLLGTKRMKEVVAEFEILIKLDRVPAASAVKEFWPLYQLQVAREDPITAYYDDGLPYYLWAFGVSPPGPRPRVWIVHYHNLQEWTFLVPTCLGIAETAVAVERYRLAHEGALPESLEQLVPEYLVRIPRDFYSENSLAYSASGTEYRISSVAGQWKGIFDFSLLNWQGTNDTFEFVVNRT